MGAAWEPLAVRIGHSFDRPELLVRALTHKSRIAGNSRSDPTRDNEQLEFLGDAVLGFLVSEALLARFPDYPEGKLSKLKAWLVSAAHLLAIAEALNLGEYLQLGRGEEMSGGRSKRALLVNAVEAILAAVYLDGGMGAARAFVEIHVLPAGPLLADGAPPAVVDYKTLLQEKAQALKIAPPKYVTIAERGPEHAKRFTVEVRVGKARQASAEGVSKKEASQRAAELLLAQWNL
ncbi:MAG: ribonuclease III [Acidobacteriaceae bacterium]|jgi:ribonuclease-3|nr:ribonuclease III [Acidobacteriaceae bacterium]